MILALFAGAGGLLMLIVALREGFRSGSIRDAGFVSAVATAALLLIGYVAGLALT